MNPHAYIEPVESILGDKQHPDEYLASIAISLKRIADSLEFFQNVVHHGLTLAGKEEPDATELLKRVYGER